MSQQKKTAISEGGHIGDSLEDIEDSPEFKEELEKIYRARENVRTNLPDIIPHYKVDIDLVPVYIALKERKSNHLANYWSRNELVQGEEASVDASFSDGRYCRLNVWLRKDGELNLRVNITDPVTKTPYLEDGLVGIVDLVLEGENGDRKVFQINYLRNSVRIDYS